MDTKTQNRKILVRIVKAIGWFLATIIIIFAILQAFLTKGTATDLVNRYANEYIEGNLSFGDVSIDLLSRFPKVGVTLTDASITYPSDTYSQWEKESSAMLLKFGKGRNGDPDTLASFSTFTTYVSLLSLTKGDIKISDLELTKPRIFAKQFSKGIANWNLVMEQSKEDTSEFVLPKVILEEINLRENPFIILCSVPDTLFGTFRLKELDFKGRADITQIEKAKAEIRIDNLHLAGRIATDTLSYRMSELRMHKSGKDFDMSLKSDALAATSLAGRMKVPFEMSTSMELPDNDFNNINIKSLDANLAHIPFKASGSIQLKDNKTEIKATAEIDNFNFSTFIQEYGKALSLPASEIETDATLSFDTKIDGTYCAQTGQLPEITAELKIPDSKINLKKIDRPFKLGLLVKLATNSGKLDINLSHIYLDGPGIDLKFNGKAADFLGENPLYTAKGNLSAILDTISTAIPDSLGYFGSGNLSGAIKAQVSKKDIEGGLAHIAKQDISLELTADKLTLGSRKDTASIRLDSTLVKISAMGNTIDNSIAKGERVLGISADAGRIYLKYKDSLRVAVRDLSTLVQNSADFLESKKDKGFYPFLGEFSAKSIFVNTIDSCLFMVQDTKDEFRIFPKADNPKIPVLKLKSTNSGIYVKEKANRLGIQDINLDVQAAMSTFEKRQRDTTRRRAARAERVASDFDSEDIKFDLGETLTKYYREWAITGKANIAKVRAITPLFPLENSIENFSGSFSNDEISIDTVTVHSGESNISAYGKVSRLRRAILRKGIINLSLGVSTTKLNANELLAAYIVGSEQFAKEPSIDNANLSDEEYAELISIDTTATIDQASSGLIVIPGNIEASLTVDGSNISYGHMDISKVGTLLTIKDRCIQIKDCIAQTNMGQASFNGFYATRSKTDIKTGMNLNFKDITAEKAILMMPAIDTLMPMLKSFQGNMNCEVAATAELDTNMNFKIPSLNGVIRISGDGMHLKTTKELQSLTKLLKFDNTKDIYVDRMSVEGLIAQSRLEIFPFEVEVDRYRLAMSGTHSMDMSYRYHVSILKSPLVLKFGIDIYGNNLDEMKYKIGKAKYKNNIPVFSKVIDEVKYDLGQSIDNIFQKGVNKAINEHSNMSAIKTMKDNIKYIAAEDMATESLDEKETNGLQTMSNLFQGITDNIINKENTKENE
jgi:hypothetical protein